MEEHYGTAPTLGQAVELLQRRDRQGALPAEEAPAIRALVTAIEPQLATSSAEGAGYDDDPACHGHPAGARRQLRRLRRRVRRRAQ